MKNISLQSQSKFDVQCIDSREVAEMLEKTHADLMKDVRKYQDYLAEGNFPLCEFFLESQYIDSNQRERPNYQITKKGCEFLAHKLTGKKGTLFTARYIDRFHQMEEKLVNSPFGQFTNQIPTTLSDALMLAGSLAKENEQLLEENQQQKTLIEEYKPKADKLDQMSNYSEGITLADFSKAIIDKHKLDQRGIDPKDIYRWFRENEYTCKGRYRFNKPKKHTLANGYMVLKTIGVNQYGKDRTIGLITPLGFDFFEFLILKEVDTKQKWGWR